jgi:DNA-binding NtrC family response regulator
MNGHVILQEIVSFDPDAFVVILSGNSFKENIIAALEDGAQGFVTKPFTKDKLLHYIESCETTKLSRMQHHPTATQHVHQ